MASGKDGLMEGGPGRGGVGQAGRGVRLQQERKAPQPQTTGSGLHSRSRLCAQPGRQVLMGGRSSPAPLMLGDLPPSGHHPTIIPGGVTGPALLPAPPRLAWG